MQRYLGWLPLVWLAGVLVAVALWWPEVRLRQLTLNTAWLVLAVSVVALPVGTLLACLVVRTDVPGGRAALVVLAILGVFPLIVYAAGWQAGFGLGGGWHFPGAGQTALQGWYGAWLVHAMAAIPWVVLIVGAGLIQAPAFDEEIARLEWPAAVAFWRVTLRSVMGSIALAALWVAVSMAGEIAVTDIFQVRTLAEELYTELAIGAEPGSAPLQMGPLASLIAWSVLLAVVAMSWGIRGYSERASWPRPFQLGAWRCSAAAVVWIVLLVIAGIPVSQLVYKAGVLVTRDAEGLERSWDGAKCARMVLWIGWSFRRSLWWSLEIGIWSALLSTVLATPLAWWGVRGGRGRWVTWGIVGLCLGMPAPLVGLLVMRLLNQPAVPGLTWLYDRTVLGPVLVQVLRALPWSVLILWVTLTTVPRRVYELALLEGWGGVETIWRLLLPWRWAGFALAFWFAWLWNLGEVSASILVMPPGVSTWATDIFQLSHYGVEDQLASLCLALLALLALGSVVGIHCFKCLAGGSNLPRGGDAIDAGDAPP